jgi:hypothetical protein
MNLSALELDGEFAPAEEAIAGTEADVFVFNKGDSFDTVWDFSAAQGDKVRIDPDAPTIDADQGRQWKVWYQTSGT